MTLVRCFLAGGAALALGACAGPEGQTPPMGGTPGGYPSAPGYGQSGSGYGQPMGYPPSTPGGYPGGQYPQQPGPPPASGYQPQMSEEYRTAYDIGARDRSYGYLSDSKRAYTRFGGGFESSFQEGYNDGFNGAAMRH